MLEIEPYPECVGEGSVVEGIVEFGDLIEDDLVFDLPEDEGVFIGIIFEATLWAGGQGVFDSLPVDGACADTYVGAKRSKVDDIVDEPNGPAIQRRAVVVRIDEIHALPDAPGAFSQGYPCNHGLGQSGGAAAGPGQ